MKLISKSVYVPFLYLLFDFFILILLFYISILIRLDILPSIFPNLAKSYIDLKSYLWVVIFPIFVFLYEGLYTKRFTFWDEVKYIWKSLFISGVWIVFLLFFLKKSEEYSRLIIMLWLFLSAIVLPIVRPRFKKLLYRLNIGKEKLLIVGANETGINFLKALKKEDNLGYEVVGFVDDNIKERKIDGIKVYRFTKNIDRYIKVGRINVVAISISNKTSEEISDLVNKILYQVKNVLYIPNIKEIPFVGVDTRYFFKEDLLALEIKNNLANKFSFFLKRVFDYTISITILPILIPVMVIISLFIKLTSKGPVIFSQKRVGKDGKVFKCYKFRTMYEDAEERLKEILENNPDLKVEWLKNRKLKNDPRITPIGKFLRKTSLDELPQIFNVLKGDMSLVGPRPVTTEEIKMYYKESAYYYYSVLPGITGLWQVSGRSNTDYENRIALDTWYVRNWSVWLDVVILFKTVKIILKREGAY